MEFCAEESCGKCTPCRIGSVRGVEVIDRIIADEDRDKNLVLLDDLCEVMTDGSLCAMGGLTPMPVRSAIQHFPEDFDKPGVTPPPRATVSSSTGTPPPPTTTGSSTSSTSTRRHRNGTTEDRHDPAQGTRPRHAGRDRVRPPSSSRSTGSRSACPKAPRSCARPRSPASTCRSCAPPTASRPFGSCRLCLVEVEGGKGTPASCTLPCADGMKVTTQSDKLAKLRRGVMELYISDHPLDCLTCPANGDCELQDMAGVVGLREVRYGYEGENHLDAPKDTSNPYFDFDPSKCIVCSRCVRACDEVQGTFALTISGTRLRLGGVGERGRDLPRLRVRLVRRLRAGLPDVHASGEVGHRARHADPLGASPRAPTAASAARSRPSCAATSWSGWCPTRTAAPTRATPA